MVYFCKPYVLRVCKKCSHIGISLFAHAGNVHLHRYHFFTSVSMWGNPSSWKWRGGWQFISVQIGLPPVVPRNIPRQLLPQGPFTLSLWGVPAAFGEWVFAGHSSSTPSQTPWNKTRQWVMLCFAPLSGSCPSLGSAQTALLARFVTICTNALH